ncbi:MAG: prepilin-type N-terminal cleavage/methylation domain-containing protein, partial [Kiritimatiellae bacterium]|nr:prepilin-type N-terminal cleavage/methylation domain-containing protein [Kiritimatiellia bacterium]
MNHQPSTTFRPSTIHHEPSTKRNAFTLVEVLAAMAVLVLLVLALTRMFVEASSITKRGTTMLMRNSTMETAMETLLQDAESMMVNDRLACYVQANTLDNGELGPDGFGFDDVWFIGTSGDQDDDMPYEYFHFYITNDISTNAVGAPYVRFNLMKDRMIFAVGDKNGFYALDSNDTQWWIKAMQYPAGRPPWEGQVIAENLVRFDIYCTGWDGTGWMGGDYAGIHRFDSTRGPQGNPAMAGVPPAAFDIYLQITSPETAVESGMALMPGVDAATQKKAREAMIRDSASL